MQLTGLIHVFLVNMLLNPLFQNLAELWCVYSGFVWNRLNKWIIFHFWLSGQAQTKDLFSQRQFFLLSTSRRNRRWRPVASSQTCFDLTFPSKDLSQKYQLIRLSVQNMLIDDLTGVWSAWVHQAVARGPRQRLAKAPSRVVVVLNFTVIQWSRGFGLYTLWNCFFLTLKQSANILMIDLHLVRTISNNMLRNFLNQVVLLVYGRNGLCRIFL